jgi:hypothetical protein
VRSLKGKPRKGERMKLSMETRVAAAITASFIALTLGSMAQENSGSETRRHAQNNPVNVGELTKDASPINEAVSVNENDRLQFPRRILNNGNDARRMD